MGRNEEDVMRECIDGHDEKLFKVYCADHSYTTLKLPLIAQVSKIIKIAKQKLSLGSDLVLCEVKSSGGLFYLILLPFLYFFSILNRLLILKKRENNKSPKDLVS